MTKHSTELLFTGIIMFIIIGMINIFISVEQFIQFIKMVNYIAIAIASLSILLAIINKSRY